MTEATMELDADFECGFCCKELQRMTNPRQLPCQHVFCLECLEEHAKENKGEVICGDCSVTYTKPNISKLPKVTKQQVPVLPKLKCEGHDCTGNLASCYCCQCARRMCDTHKQAHTSFFGDSHNVIPISTYSVSPGMYKTITCSAHGNEVMACCCDCGKQLCQWCDQKDEKCSANKGKHNITAISKLEKEITMYVGNLLDSASKKIKEFCEKDKEVWKLLDDEELKCKATMKAVEQLRSILIDAVNSECLKIQNLVDIYQQEVTKEIQVYHAKVMAKKDSLEATQDKVHDWMKESHVTEQVKQRDEMVKDLKQQLSEKVPVYLPAGKPLPTFIDEIVEAATTTPSKMPKVVLEKDEIALPKAAYALVMMSTIHKEVVKCSVTLPNQEKITLWLKKTEYASTLKQRIQHQSDISGTYLIHENKLLKDQVSITECIKRSSRSPIFTCIYPVKIFCKTLQQKMLTILVTPFHTVKSLKAKIEHLEKIPFAEQRLIFAGRQLEEDRTLEYYKIQKESIIDVVLRLRG